MAISGDKLFAKSTIAKAYQKFRPTYPEEIMERVVSFLKHKNTGPWSLAIDVGCGSGQSTRSLSDHFETVIGCDVSNNQLEEAIMKDNPNNIKYQLGSDGAIPAENNSVDLVTAGAAAHWFDLKKFYSEVDRVLKPNGCLALYGYSHENLYKNAKGQELQAVLDELVDGTLQDSWPDDSKLYKNLYNDIMLPYKERERYDILMELNSTVVDFVGYLSTWSASHIYMTTYPDRTDTFQNLSDNFMSVLGSETTPENTYMHICRPFFVLLARKPGE
ncbi:putative methyltransferase DDB_G0268948 isoform X2 [Glandiceps talaboti]